MKGRKLSTDAQMYTCNWIALNYSQDLFRALLILSDGQRNYVCMQLENICGTYLASQRTLTKFVGVVALCYQHSKTQLCGVDNRVQQLQQKQSESFDQYLACVSICTAFIYFMSIQMYACNVYEAVHTGTCKSGTARAYHCVSCVLTNMPCGLALTSSLLLNYGTGTLL